MNAPPFLEVEVLQGLGRTPVQRRGGLRVPELCVRVALGRPRRGEVALRAQPEEQALGGRELAERRLRRLLTEQRAAEDEMRVPTLLDVVVAPVQDRQRVPRLLLGENR